VKDSEVSIRSIEMDDGGLVKFAGTLSSELLSVIFGRQIPV
jgi:hypothetical protein